MLGVIKNLRKGAARIACNSFLYNMSLGGEAPERLLVKPADAWPGDPGAAAVPVSEDGADIWDAANERLHRFMWLRDMRAEGSEKTRMQGRNLIESWVRRHHGWSAEAWAPGVAGRRVAMWISHYEHFGAGGDEVFQDLFFESLARQSRHLARSVPGELAGIELLQAAKGLLYAGLAFEGREPWIAQALGVLEKETARQVLGDGAHVTRSADALLECLSVYLDTRTALAAGGHPLPEKIQHAIDRMAPALKFFLHGDKKFSLFNGAQEGNEDIIESALEQAGGRARALQSLPCAGYERLALGKSLVIMDTGRPPNYPYDTRAHAAPLSFEFSYGRERLFVNCGSHPGDSEWREALRATPAHNALTLDHRNACEIRAGGHFGRKVRCAVSVREDAKDACLAEGSHDGYMALNGITHRRRLYLSKSGEDLRGEDLLHCSVGLTAPQDFAIRFHIHPRVMVSLIRDDTEALLRMPGGAGWRFHQAGGLMKLEDSIYLGEGARPRKTKQIAIYARMTEDLAQVKWALQKEG